MQDRYGDGNHPDEKLPRADGDVVAEVFDR